MTIFPPTVIIRHRKENLRKCSLRGLENRNDLRFVTYPLGQLPPLDRYLLLSLDGPPLTSQDSSAGLVLLDGTWRYAQVMFDQWGADLPIQTRCLPHSAVTAYPRVQTHCSDPLRGLASVEALFLAHLILRRETEGLLDHYYWKQDFLEANAALLTAVQAS